jgi:ribosome recycling factor
METLDDIMLDAIEKMSKSTEVMHHEFAGLHTGKASPAMVENVKVDYYGSPTRLMEIANISTPEPRMLVINPFDPSSLDAIEKAIIGANIGITPVNDGRLIRLPIPEMSEERRIELVKIAKRLAEEARIAVRNVRRDANAHIKKIEQDSKISEDQRDDALDEIQKETDKHIEEIDKSLQSKETEVMAV